jgi:RpiR family carbohydrate utilization transcriptional regulator
MTPSERAIAQYILNNESEVIYLTARELADRVGVSDASIVRFCQSIGYSGFKELKLRIALASQASEPHRVQVADASLQGKLDHTFERAVTSIRSTQRVLSEEHLVLAAERIRQASRVYLLGAGTSGVVARDSQIKLARLGITALYDDQSQNMAIHMALATSDDVVMAFSHSGNTLDIVNLLRIGRERGAFTIAVTNNMASRIVQAADVLLLTASDELPFHSFATTSRITQLLVVDCLITVLTSDMGSKVNENLEKIAEAVTGLSNGDS